MICKTIFSVVLLIALSFPLSNFINAQDIIIESPISVIGFPDMISRISNWLFTIGLIFTVLMIIIAGYLFTTSAGNIQKVEKARKIILFTLIGFVIISLSSGIISLTQLILGINAPSPDMPTNLFTPPLTNPNALVSIPINKTFKTSNSNIFTWDSEPIFSLSITGRITINSPNGFARVILTDSQGREYLVHERIGPFDQGIKIFENFCHETCALNGIIPKSLDTELSEAFITINTVFTLKNYDNFNNQVKTRGISSYASTRHRQQALLIIDKINSYNRANGLRWTAGETGISKYTYSQKKILMGIKPQEDLPNLRGFEYYKGGIYETTRPQATTQPKSQTTSNLPASFDWRNRHGKNWMTSVKDQGQCGSCWAFAVTGGIEAVTNLYFNQKLNLDLSEQQLLSCGDPLSPGSCFGGNPLSVLNYYHSNGLVSEDCFPYRASDAIPCQKCNNWQQKITRTLHNGLRTATRSESIYGNENEIKLFLIENGPLAATYDLWMHAMTLAGYDTTPEGNTILIYKNSWGENWGEKGYAKKLVKKGIYVGYAGAVDVPIEVSFMPNTKIKCTDEDKDKHCWWGISDAGISESWRKNNCPSSCWNNPQKDCDDSNSNLGPYDQNYNCVNLASAPDTIPPQVGKLSFVQIGRRTSFESYVFDNTEVVNCVLVINGQEKKPLHFSQAPCRNCKTYIDPYYFETAGNFKVQARCWDPGGNVGVGETVNITIRGSTPIDEQPPVVSKITPVSSTINTSINFSVNVSDDTGVQSCNFYINNAYIAKMNLSSPNCLNCAASINHKFISKGTYSAYAECFDVSGKTAKGKTVNIIVSDKPQYVSVRLIEVDKDPVEVNQTVRLSSSVSSTSGRKISSCFLMINNQSQGIMNLGQTNCYNCAIHRDYVFTKTGVYSVYVRCVDEGGNIGEGNPVNINVSERVCPLLEYPTNMWQRVWYKLSGRGKGACLGQGLNEGSIKFDNNWGARNIAFGRSDNIYLTSSRAISIPTSGNYTFTVGSDDGVRVWINDILRLDKWTNRQYKADSFNVNLSAGNHRFRIDYYEKDGTARISFNYQQSTAPVTQHTLSVSKLGNGSGTVISSPLGINCGPVCFASFDSGASITLIATSSPGSSFGGWSGACSGTSNTCNVPMSSNQSLTAIFNQQLPPTACSWTPCNPTSSWSCAETKTGSSPYCEGRPIGWENNKNDGEIMCPEGTIASQGFCGKKNDDFVITSESRVKMVPSPQTFSGATMFRPRSVWYCNFGCRGWFCGPDGCAWACCKPGQIPISKVDLKIFNISGRLIYSNSFNNQSAVIWNGRNTQGQLMASGAYIYTTDTHLADGRKFTTRDMVYIKR